MFLLSPLKVGLRITITDKSKILSLNILSKIITQHD